MLDCPLEYKKGESATQLELTKASDFANVLKQEEKEVEELCNEILRVKPDVVITEKGVSDLAQHFLLKHNVSVIRRIRKTDNLRIGRVSGAVICNRPEELEERDVGTECGLFEVKKIGDEYFAYFLECENPKACTIMLRGASKDVLNEIERNLHDAMSVARNIMVCGNVIPGGGCVEMSVSRMLYEESKKMTGLEAQCIEQLSEAFEIIPKTLCQNCGADVIRTVTELRAKHSEEGPKYSIDGNTGKITHVDTMKLWESVGVRHQTFKTAIECSSMLLRIDDVVSGVKKDRSGGGPKGPAANQETFGDARDG